MDYSHKFTATQRRILEVLGDGQRHHCDELLQRCFYDRIEPDKNLVRSHLKSMRNVLRLVGEDIICEYYYRRFYYRHVRMLPRGNGSSGVDPATPAELP